MKRYIVIVGIIALGLVGCGNEKKETEVVESNEKDAAECALDSNAVDEINPNGATELALLMRKMDEDFNAARVSLKQGKVPDYNFDHSTIKTAEPTKKHIVGDPVFASFADIYLSNVKAVSEASKDSITSAHNAVVESCIQCHKSYCTGPIGRIRKLKINPKNVSFVEEN